MLWFTSGALIVSLGFLAYRAKRRRGYRPLLLGLGAVTLIIAGKFVIPMTSVFYSGIVLLIVASLWNSWPQKPRTTLLDL